MEFPDYRKKTSLKFMEKYANYTFHGVRRSSGSIKNPYKLKNLSFYQDNFLEESTKCQEEIKVIQALKKCAIDIRAINYMNRYLQKEYGDTETVPFNMFSRLWITLIGRETAYKNPNVEQKLMHILVADDKEEIDLQKLERFSNILEFLSVKVKKNKNESTDILKILNPIYRSTQVSLF